MYVFLLLSAYCFLIFAASMFGGRISTLLKMTHLRTQLMISGVGGLMLGIALLHLLPHAAESLGSVSRACSVALLGLAGMFLLIRWFHTHDHAVVADAEADAIAGSSSEESAAHHHGHHHDHHGSHACDHGSGDGAVGIGWTGLFFGLLLHTLVDGVALASSVLAECEHGAWLGLGGLGTFLAVFLHKPLDAFAITSVMNRQNWSKASQRWVNFIYSLACPIGAMAFYFGVSRYVTNPDVLGYGLAISAGFFIGIALADLLPEVEFHHHDRGKLTTAFLIGIGVAVGVENLPGHDHSLHSDSSTPHGEHAHEGHSHDAHDHSGHDHSGHDH